MAVTPNLLIPIDVPGATGGSPSFTWAVDNETFKTIVDAHTHMGTAGTGLKIASAALNINGDVSWAVLYNLTDLRSLRFTNSAAPLALGTDVTAIYVSGGDLYYNNANGAQVKLTSGAGINLSGVNGFTGLSGTTAAATYTVGTTTFSFTSDSLKSAAIDVGALTIRQTATASAHGITIKSPNALAADYNLTLAAALPAATNLTMMTVDNTGAIAFGLAPVLTARPTFAGLNPGNTADTTVGNVRWSGTAFEGYRNGAFRGLEGWEFLAATKLGAPAATTGAITVAARDVLMIVVEVLGSQTSFALRFNGDATANYYSRSLDVASGATTIVNTARASDTALRIVVAGVPAGRYLGRFEIYNFITDTKCLNGSYTCPATSIATQDTSNLSLQGKWGNTAAQITSIELFFDSGAVNLGTGSGFIVFGKNLS